MMMIKTDEITGVSFDNCEISSDMLYDIYLWKDEEEEQEEEEE